VPSATIHNRLTNRNRGDDDFEATLGRAAQFLADLPAAWKAATEEQRNQLAMSLFEEVSVKRRLGSGR